MHRYGRAAALAIGLALLAFVGMSPTGFTQYGSCEIFTLEIKGDSEGSVGQRLTFQAFTTTVGTGQLCNMLSIEYSWSLKSAPQGAGPWSATGEVVTYTPRVAGEHILKVVARLTAPSGYMVDTKDAEHKPMVREPQPQEFALILGPGSSGQLQTFPAKLTISAGAARLFLTSLDRDVTVVIRREGAQAGVATVLVELGKLTTVEVELAQGVYGVLDQATNSQLGQIEAR